MRDRGLSVLTQYGLEAAGTYRGRGALVCQCNNEWFLIKEFQGSSSKLEEIYDVIERIKANEHIFVDQIVRNKEGAAISQDAEGQQYILKQWCDGRECDTKSTEDILHASEVLAYIHKDMYGEVKEIYKKKDMDSEYRKHNQEFKKIKSFIQKKNRKNDFEQKYLDSMNYFYEAGKEAIAKLERFDYQKFYEEVNQTGQICHGDFNQHNILFTKSGASVINFDRWLYDTQMYDVYQFCRKILEKHSWDSDLFYRMIEAYASVKEIRPSEWEYLKIRFAFPEKYWKIANYYYNNNKAWISGKNVEKLTTVVEQRHKWKSFIDTIDRA